MLGIQVVELQVPQDANRRTPQMATESNRVHIDASLYERAATIAQQEGQSVDSLIEDLLRERMSTRQEATPSSPSNAAPDEAVNEVWDRMSRSLQGGPDLGFGDSRAA